MKNTEYLDIYQLLIVNPRIYQYSLVKAQNIIVQIIIILGYDNFTFYVLEFTVIDRLDQLGLLRSIKFTTSRCLDWFLPQHA